MLGRIGIGYDVHRLVEGRPLILGGVRIPYERGLAGHSDADVVLHAICDALLGAAGLGDIGEMFPDTDPQYRDADSAALLHEVWARVKQAGHALHNVDVIVHAQVPKISPHKSALRASIAALLGVSIEMVGVKATTNEGLGEIGRGEAIACWAAVLLVDAPPAD